MGLKLSLCRNGRHATDLKISTAAEILSKHRSAATYQNKVLQKSQLLVNDTAFIAIVEAAVDRGYVSSPGAAGRAYYSLHFDMPIGIDGAGDLAHNFTIRTDMTAFGASTVRTITITPCDLSEP